METLLIVVVAILAVLVIGLFLLIGLLVFKLFIKKEQINFTSMGGVQSYPPEVANAIAMAKQNKDMAVSQFCIDHPELYAKGVCSICNEPYCELCITKEMNVKVARKHLDLILDSKWEMVHMLQNEETGPDKLNELFRIKKSLWRESQTPIITHRQFKINIETDQIETYTFVQVREQDLAEIEPQLKFLSMND